MIVVTRYLLSIILFYDTYFLFQMYTSIILNYFLLCLILTKRKIYVCAGKHALIILTTLVYLYW